MYNCFIWLNLAIPHRNCIFITSGQVIECISKCIKMKFYLAFAWITGVTIKPILFFKTNFNIKFFKMIWQKLYLNYSWSRTCLVKCVINLGSRNLNYFWMNVCHVKWITSLDSRNHWNVNIVLIRFWRASS